MFIITHATLYAISILTRIITLIYTGLSLVCRCPSGTKRVRVTVPEQELLIRCYQEKGGQSWEEVLEHVRDRLDSLPFYHLTIEFYMKQDDQPAIKRI